MTYFIGILNPFTGESFLDLVRNVNYVGANCFKP